MPRIIVAVAASGLFFGTTRPRIGRGEAGYGSAFSNDSVVGPTPTTRDRDRCSQLGSAVEDYSGKAAGRQARGPLCRSPEQAGCGGQGSSGNRLIDEDGVDMIADVPNSAVALAISFSSSRTRTKAFIGSGAGTAALTGSAPCSPNTVQWTYDTWELGHALGRAIVEQGKKKLVLHRHRLCVQA